MRAVIGIVFYCGLLAASASSQSVDSEPSPMEALASHQGVRTTWSNEVARWEQDGTRLVLTAVVLEDSARKLRGVKVDLSSQNAKEQVYLDEQATERTRLALVEISDAVALIGMPGSNSCIGAKEFSSKYDWPWNKYHELNVSFCGESKNPVLVLHGRGRLASFRFPGKSPTVLAEVLATAVQELMSANASCYEKSSGRLVGSTKSITSVLASPDGLYRAYAVSEAVASQSPNTANAECQNTSKLFVSGPKSNNFRPVLVVEPSPEALGNNIDLVDWSPNGHRLLLAEGVWQWGSDAGGLVVRIYDAESENLSRESLVNDAFSRYVGKNCVAVFYPVGFSSGGQVVATAGPFFEEGEDNPVEDSCVQQKGFWLIDPLAETVSQLPDNYRVQRYGKIVP